MHNPQMLSSSSTVIRSDTFIASEVDGEVVALNIDKGMCYGLNRVGSRLWGLLDKPARVADVCSQLVREYKVDYVVCEQQVLDLLEELRAEGMIICLDATADGS